MYPAAPSIWSASLDDLHRELGRVVLGHREVRHPLLGELAAVGHPRGTVREQAGGLDLGGELGDLPLDPLEVGDRLAERLALLRRTRPRTSARPRRSPMPRAATIGRIELRPSIARRKPPISPTTFSAGTRTSSSRSSPVSTPLTPIFLSTRPTDTPGHERSTMNARDAVVGTRVDRARLGEHAVPVGLAARPTSSTSCR